MNEKEIVERPLLPDYKLALPPHKKCSFCGKPLNVPCVYNTGDGWIGFWECEELHGEDEEYMSDDWWPFIDDVATEDDFRRIGFAII